MLPSVSPNDERWPISFPGWKLVLAEAALPPEAREQFRRAILAFLKRCKEERVPTSVASIKRHLQNVGESAAREALRWFYRAARAGAVVTRSKAAQRDAGSRDSSQRLGDKPLHLRARGGVPPVAARERGFLWRTEARVNGFANAA